MSLINRMLKDLDAQPAKADVAPIYRPAARRLPGWYWWILLLLPLALWLWWQPLQQWLHPVVTPVIARQPHVEPTPPAVVVAAAATPNTVSAAVATVTPEPAVTLSKTVAQAMPENTKSVAQPALSQNLAAEHSRTTANTETELVTADDNQALTTEETAQTVAMDEPETTTEPEPLGEMYVEEQKLSAGEIAALERRKYQQALARRDNVGAQQALLQVLANDPLDISSRKQLAALYYGENQLNSARDVLQQGIILMPAQPGPGEKTPPGHKKIVRVITVQIVKPQQHILHGFHQAFLFRRCDQFAPSTLARRASAFFLLAMTYGIGAFI